MYSLTQARNPDTHKTVNLTQAQKNINTKGAEATTSARYKGGSKEASLTCSHSSLWLGNQITGGSVVVVVGLDERL